MGNGSKRGGERVLESRHLVGLFLGVVLLCCVFFTLGYVMGHTQYGGAVQASDAPAKAKGAPDADADETEPAAKTKKPDAPASPAASEWDFYSKKDTSHLEPAAAPAASPEAPAAPPVPVAKAVETSAHVPVRQREPKFAKGAMVLQL